MEWWWRHRRQQKHATAAVVVARRRILYWKLALLPKGSKCAAPKGNRTNIERNSKGTDKRDFHHRSNRYQTGEQWEQERQREKRFAYSIFHNPFVVAWNFHFIFDDFSLYSLETFSSGKLKWKMQMAKHFFSFVAVSPVVLSLPSFHQFHWQNSILCISHFHFEAPEKWNKIVHEMKQKNFSPTEQSYSQLHRAKIIKNDNKNNRKIARSAARWNRKKSPQKQFRRKIKIRRVFNMYLLWNRDRRYVLRTNQ